MQVQSAEMICGRPSSCRATQALTVTKVIAVQSNPRLRET